MDALEGRGAQGHPGPHRAAQRPRDERRLLRLLRRPGDPPTGPLPRRGFGQPCRSSVRVPRLQFAGGVGAAGHDHRGTNRPIGRDADRIVRATREALAAPPPASQRPTVWEGQAGRRIAAALVKGHDLERRRNAAIGAGAGKPIALSWARGYLRLAGMVGLGDSGWDIGANLGLFSFAAAVPAGPVGAFWWWNPTPCWQDCSAARPPSTAATRR